jgi:hypothetical protein
VAAACGVYRKMSTDARALRLFGSVERVSSRCANEYSVFQAIVFGWIHKHWTYSSLELIHLDTGLGNGRRGLTVSDLDGCTVLDHNLL